MIFAVFADFKSEINFCWLFPPKKKKKQSNTLLALCTIRRVLILQRVSHEKSSQQQLQSTGSSTQSAQLQLVRCHYRQLHLFVCSLPALAVLWFLSVLALEQTQTSAFQFIFAAFNLICSLGHFCFHRQAVGAPHSDLYRNFDPNE